MTQQPLVKKDCGLHYGSQSGPCSKCAYFDRLRFAPEFKKYRAGLQYSGYAVERRYRRTSQGGQLNMSEKTKRVPLCYQSKNPLGIQAEAEICYNDDYIELAISCFRGSDRVADVYVGLTESGEIRVLLTLNGEGDGDHELAVFPLRPRETAVEDFQ